MRVCSTEEMEKLREIFAPYEEGCHLVKDAPKEAIEAKERYRELFKIEQKRNRDIDFNMIL